MEDAGGLLKYNRETENNNRNEDKDKVLFFLSSLYCS